MRCVQCTTQVLSYSSGTCPHTHTTLWGKKLHAGPIHYQSRRGRLLTGGNITALSLRGVCTQEKRETKEGMREGGEVGLQMGSLKEAINGKARPRKQIDKAYEEMTKH